MTVFGMGLDSGFNGLGVVPFDPARLIADAREADRAGLDVVSVTDHPYHHEHLEAYATIGYVLGSTSRVSGLVSVTNLACRPAPLLARTVSTMSQLSGGRLVLGIGAGVLWDEIVKFGVEPRTPGARVRMLEEGITLVRALTGGGAPVTFEGEFFRVDGLVPTATPTPPIWTGSMGPASLALTGRMADGWLPAAAQDWRSDYVAAARSTIDSAAIEAGRDPAAIATVYNLFGTITDTAVDVVRGVDSHGIGWLRGTVDQWVEELTGAVEEHRAGGFVFFPVADGIDEQQKMRSQWLHEIVPAVRAATG
ncbi:LLM class flavin-dependent oxidoreductase [Pseudonocardia sp. MH-G8]|uniref:LLM class flavin-dependent oxidoreductase n=1 Tax=Pseudonocardia sp. MH-G8 TaxID=1854588 RepID=UPI000BA07CF1|nr:LLM class flavin-dependent oxidoreductase [Pseudonocardia sp. MH-G8]OZM76241.1 5,10-methylene tetrahydromethanopterin reductase [Pseudonocardia sp. MH-G8]